MLEIKQVSISVGSKPILRGVNAYVGDGEVFVVFGPNGSGKTSLLMAIAGVPGYEITEGEIVFDGTRLNGLPPNERAKLGIALAHQTPPEVPGLRLRDLLKICAGKSSDEELGEEELELAKRLRVEQLLDREVNVGFSGGERKRAELLQVLVMKPKLLLLDEPDSGVDVESLKLIAGEIQRYLEESGASALLVTHQGEIINYIEAEYGCVLVNGVAFCYQNPKEVLKTIKQMGYDACVKCMSPVSWRK